MAQPAAGAQGANAKMPGLEAVELVGILGFSLFFAWMFSCFYWLFAATLQDMDLSWRNLTQSLVFVGVVAGYALMHFLGRSAAFNPFKLPMVVACGACSLLLPAAAVVVFYLVALPLPLLWAVNFFTGVDGAILTVLWLDVMSRSTSGGEYRFASFSLFAGAVFMALIMLMPLAAQAAMAALYGAGCTVLLRFCSKKAPLNDSAPFVETKRQEWEFSKEIGPVFAVFGIVFGLCFAYLFNKGGWVLVAGLLFVLPGSALVAIAASAGREAGITVIQRIILCVTVFSCVATPFVPLDMQVFTIGIAIAAWAALLSVNYALVVRKSKLSWDAPVFRTVPRRLVLVAVGFALGWAMACAVAFAWGAQTEAFGTIRLVMAVVLVVVFTVFMPDAHHHDRDAMDELAQGTTPRAATQDCTHDRVFAAKCMAAAELYKLTPREADILGYLARGRNAAYLQEKLCISPHTVKSHIYSIYRKFDIHSQQKLMDFIEEYPLSERELARFCGEADRERE